VLEFRFLFPFNEQSEQQKPENVDPSDQLEAVFCQPILTLSLDDENIIQDDGQVIADVNSVEASNDSLSDLTLDEISTAQAGQDVAEQADITEKISEDNGVLTTVAEITANGEILACNPTEDNSIPVITYDTDLDIEYATSIEIRGPPADAGEILTTCNTDNYITPDEFAELFPVSRSGTE